MDGSSKYIVSSHILQPGDDSQDISMHLQEPLNARHSSKFFDRNAFIKLASLAIFRRESHPQASQKNRLKIGAIQSIQFMAPHPAA